MFSIFSFFFYTFFYEKKKYIKCSKYTPIIKYYIQTYILKYPSFDYIVLMKKITRKFNITISKTSLYEIINKLNFTRKKFKLRIIPNKDKYKNNIKNFKKKINKIPLDDIISIDETSIDTHIHPNLGWSLRGTKLKKNYERSRIKYTIITAITNKRILNYKIIKRSSNAEDFKSFLIDTLYKTNKSMYLLMDNARIHHSKVVVDYIKTTNHQIIYNVPYCPEYNPIELVFSKFKSIIRKKIINNNTNLIKNIKIAFNKITKKDLIKFYNYSLKFT